MRQFLGGGLDEILDQHYECENYSAHPRGEETVSAPLFKSERLNTGEVDWKKKSQDSNHQDTLYIQWVMKLGGKHKPRVA